MAKTGSQNMSGTAEGAALGRAIHTRLAKPPVFNDTWALPLLSAENQTVVLAAVDETAMRQIEGFDASPIFAINLGCLRYAEDAVEAGANAGLRQYLVLGAGLDSFALRRDDLAPSLSVFELDHPDVQAMKRERIALSEQQPAQLPQFIPIDFEQDDLGDVLAQSLIDTSKPTIVSWLNTLHYLTQEATEATLSVLAQTLVPGSQLILNYPVEVPLTTEQSRYLQAFLAVLALTDEPFVSRWTPAAFTQLLQRHGFELREHATEDDLIQRYFSGRADGLKPGLPLRVLVATKVGEAAKGKEALQ